MDANASHGIGDLQGLFVEVLPGTTIGGRDLAGQKGKAWCGSKADEYVVDLFHGQSVELPASQLKCFNPPRPEDGGFDFVWPFANELLEGFGWDIAEKLVTQGFCIVQCTVDPSSLQVAAGEVGNLAGWKCFVEEFETAYLGRHAQGKATWLSPDNFDEETPSGLELCDRILSQAAAVLEPLTQAMFGFGAIGRTDGIVMAPFSNGSEEESLRKEREVLDDVQIHAKGRVEEHLKFVQQQKIGMHFFLRGEDHVMVLHPRGETDIELNCGSGKLLLFRQDRCGFTYRPCNEALVLQAWLLSEGQGTMLQEFDGPIEQYDKALGLENGPTAPIYGMTGKSVSLMSMDCMLAINGLGPEFYWAALVAGGDGGRHLSPTRWDPDAYFIADKDQAFGKYYSNHGGFVLEETCLSFDNDFFGFKEEEVYNLDPCQRNTMEIGYNCLHKAGWSRKSLAGAQIGVYAGNCGTDWAGVRLNPMWNPVNENTYFGTNAHVANVRLSYIFGMRGPTSTSDTACSSSLVALGSAHNALRRVETDQMRVSSNTHIDWALVVGTNGLWGPFSWIGLSGPRMLSSKGRCFTFDGSADGFARGEGTSGITLSITDKDHSNRLAMVCGTCINQDGRSASMTAPHGPSQQECLRGSMREAKIVPGDVRVAELHGTGTALGDPIEVGALRGVMKQRDIPILKTSAKSNLEHGEANAGMAGLIKCFVLLIHGSCPPNIHLSSLNPHIDASDYKVQFVDDLTDLGASSGFAGVSSFGFGGTNARADLWAKATVGHHKTGKLDENKLDYITVRCSKCLGWMDHIGAQAIATLPPKPHDGAGRVKAWCIREEGAGYHMCSMCFSGGYQFGTPPNESAMPNGNLYITGTWNGWTTQDHVEQSPDGTYHYVARLGDTRMERFYFLLEKNEAFAIYPSSPNAGMEIRTVGPKHREPGHCWLIDGRDDRWAVGTFVHITLFAEPENGFRKVKWEFVLNEEQQPANLPSYRHRYFIRGSWTSGQLVPMDAVVGEPCTFEYMTRFGVTGWETFQFVRDNDPNQIIYPAHSRANAFGVPVRGPDGLGHGREWAMNGSQGDPLNIRLLVKDGHIVVTARSPSGKRSWESVDGRSRNNFSVSGSWSEKCIPMQTDPDIPDVYRVRMRMVNTIEEFQILVDEDACRAFHPEVGGFPCGVAFVSGPDNGGSNSYFAIDGEEGACFDITLDLKCEDKRWIVSWTPVSDDGLPLIPWSPESKYGIREPPVR